MDDVIKSVGSKQAS